MSRPTIDAKASGPVVQSTESKPDVRSGEFVAKAVALIGGASLVVGGVLGYAFGFLEGGRDRRDRHEV